MKKNEAAHRVPLSQPALDILAMMKDAVAHPRPDGFVFPSPTPPHGAMTTMAFKRLRDRMGLAGKATTHGFRSTLTDWAREHGFPPDVTEVALAHKLQGMRGPYERTDILVPRKQMMDQWAEHLTSSLGSRRA